MLVGLRTITLPRFLHPLLQDHLDRHVKQRGTAQERDHAIADALDAVAAKTQKTKASPISPAVEG